LGEGRGLGFWIRFRENWGGRGCMGEEMELVCRTGECWGVGETLGYQRKSFNLAGSFGGGGVRD